tara:strand:- start:5027 stop:5248 length:222 start_codon:yes stop_codon:yes gene_type:complete
MEENKLPVLKVTNIDWEQDSSIKRNLPSQMAIKWNSNDYTYNQVLNFLQQQYDHNINSLEIEKSGTWQNSGSG